jgi:hypothetical protein
VPTRFWCGNPREGDNLKDPGVDGRISKWIGGGGMNWIDLAQDRERWRATMNAVINLRVPQNVGNFITS